MNEKILEAARHCVEIGCEGCSWDGIGVCDGDPYDFAVAILGHDMKYKWHDLRKDPSYLPRRRNVYLVRTVTTYMTAMYDTFEREWIIDEGYTVIAWKEIEPFEPED